MKLLFAIAFSVSLSFPQDPGNGLEWYRSFFASGLEQNTEKRIDYALSMASEARSMNDLREEGRRLKEVGMLHLTRTRDYEKAMDHFIRCLAIEDSLRLKNEMVITFIAMSDVLAEVGNHHKSAEVLGQALEANAEKDDKEILVVILLKKGKLESAMGEPEEAFENFENALKYAVMLDEPLLKAEALYQLGLLNTKLGKYDEALKRHKTSLMIRRQVNDRKNEAVSLNAIGELYHLKGNDEKSIANHVVALEIRTQLKDQEGLAQSFNNVGQLYYQQKNYERAIANLNLGLAAARESASQNHMRKSYEYLSLCYRETGDYKSSLENREHYVMISELIENEKNQQRVIETQNRYVIERKENEIDQLESIRRQREDQLSEERRLRYFLYAMLAAGIIIAVLVTWLYVLKRRSNRLLKQTNEKVSHQNLQLQELNATKDKFFSIISHDLKGPLNSLTSFSSLLINHTDSLSKDEIRMLAGDLDKSLKNLFDLLENLLEWSRSQTGSIEFKPERFDLHALLGQNCELLGHQGKIKNIVIHGVPNEPLVVWAHRHSVNTVIRNLISNAIKFTPPGGSINVQTSHDREHVTVSVSDTGVGMSPEVVGKLFRIDSKISTKGTANEKGTGLGLILCRDFVEKNAGRIWVESEPGKGTTFYFSLPSTAPMIKKDEGVYK